MKSRPVPALCPGVARESLALRPGRYHYEAWDIYDEALRDRGLNASGSFVVR